MDRRRVLAFCPHLGQGGADRVLATLLRRLDRARFVPALAVVRRHGPFLDDVPGDVSIHELGTRRTATSVPALTRLIARERPDVVFCMHGGANIVAALAHGLARSRARLVLSERSSLRRVDRSAVRMALELPAKRLTYRRADVVAAVSEGVAEDVARELGVSRVVVVGNPMVDDEMLARAGDPVDHPWFSGPMADPVIVACGRLVEIKDYPALLEAMARIRAVGPARLVILGDGALRGQLEARARELGIADAVWFAGFDKNPFKYMARARLLLHASHAEGLPGALIQAMACGTPVVSTDCDFGPREVISEPGKNGFLVRIGDTRALADHALALLADPVLRDRVGAEARRAVQRYTVADALRRYEAVLAGDTVPR